MVLYLGLKEIIINDIFISCHHRLLNTYLGIVRICYLESQSSVVSELVEAECGEPSLRIVLYEPGEFLHDLYLIVRSGHITVRIKLRHYHGLSTAAYLLKSVKSSFSRFIGVQSPVMYMLLVILFSHLIRPAPVKGYIFIYRPDLCILYSLKKLIFPLSLFVLRITDSTGTEYHRYIGSILTYYLMELNIKVCYLLICGSLVK